MAVNTFLKNAMAIFLLFLLTYVSATVRAKTIYVDDNAPGNNKGSTWTNAYNDLRDAITDARSSPKPIEIRVAQGTYKPNESVFVLIDGITLKGGYAGFEESDPEARDINLYKTILSGDCNGDDVEVIDPVDLWSEPTRADNMCVLHSTNCNETAVLDGFIITAGRSLYGGGGMYNYNSSPTIINCTFSANTAGDDGLEGGGAIYNYYSNPALINCEFIGNSAGDSCGGGGMYNDYSNPTLINCTFIGNTAEYYGGGMINFWSNPILMDCTFADNFSPDRGGGIHNDYGSFRPTLTDCTFLRNRSGVDGGAIYNFSECSPKIADCTFKNNSAGKNGGAVANFFGNSPKFLNCLFTANSAGQDGGGMYNHGYSPAAATKITGCTFVTNSATNGSAVACDSYEKKYPIHLLITSCIFWDGENGIWNNDNSTITITYSNIQSGWTGQGNIDTDPCFVDEANGDYHLLPISPCIDAGDPDYVPGPNETDLDGKTRVIGGRIDMGVYEFQSQLILYVDGDATGSNDGSSWTDAFNFLQDALAVAYSGDEIWVAQGIYTPDSNSANPNGSGDRESTFQLINGVTLKGGYAGFGQPDPNARDIELYETILSGDLNGDDGPDFINNGENTFHVIIGTDTDETAIIDGFTITGGNANGASLFSRCGGGMLAETHYHWSNPTVTNCKFIENSAVWGGGLGDGDGLIYNCIISGNKAESSGGGVCSWRGPIRNCIIENNRSDRGGGGIGEGYGCDLFSCIIRENSAEWTGGGVSNPTGYICNCIISGNSARWGGGIYNDGDTTVLTNCTFTDNQGSGVYAGSDDDSAIVVMTNCIFWNDNYDEDYGSTFIVNYNCFQDLPDDLDGIGNIVADPCFVSTGYWDSNGVWVDGDYHLLEGSPCIDAGDPNHVPGPNETDFDGKPRVIGGRIDMGAYEYSPLTPAEVRIVPRIINLTSKGNWITAVLRLDKDYNVADIDPNSVLLEDEIQPEKFSVDEQAQVAMARFSREDVQPILDVGDINLKITGRLTDGTVFEATDTIKVIDKAGKK